MSSLSKAYEPSPIEEKWYPFWENEGLFKADATSSKPPFCIVIPPPNVTGVLHMGHALVDTLQDVLIRWKRMNGYEVLWVPGTDHAGIATQTVVEKDLFAKTGKRRKDFSREEFLSHVWAWKNLCETNILSQLKKLGCSCDWSRCRFTMDEGSNIAVRVAFKKMFDEGLIYQGDYLVNWDPVTLTALSDDEVEFEERSSYLWHIRYRVEHTNEQIVVATTRPETFFGDVAVAVNPEDPRYQHLIGKKVHLPLTHRLIPVIADSFVDPTFGTGIVKVTPAHDFTDFEVGKRHNLEPINILTPDARLNEKTPFAGLSVDEARIQVVNALKKENALEKEEPYTLRVGVSYRSKAVLQPYLSKQWYVKMSHFKEKLISAVKEKRVNLIPPHWEATYFHWIDGLRDWCISRQLWWGHQIPIWYKGDEILCYSGEGVPPIVEKEPGQWTQDPDVLDTWFSSGLWPLSTLGWPEKTADFKKFYPTSVLITGHDILFFWVARMILMGEYFDGRVPFHDAFLHGLIYGKSYWKKNKDGTTSYIFGEDKKKYDLGEPTPKDVDSKWEKMSKTKGNIIDPIEIISEYGTDALRLSLCSSATFARQIDLDRRRFEEYRNFVNKIWNGARFVFMHIETLKADDFSKGIDHSLLRLEDQWILSILYQTIEKMDQALSSYAFDQAATIAYEFFWNDFCAVFLEASKPILFGKQGNEKTQENKRKLLVVILLASIRLMHPIIPYITEELFSLLKKQFVGAKGDETLVSEAILALNAKACMVSPYPNVASFKTKNVEAEEKFSKILELVRNIRNIRTEMTIPPNEKTELYLARGPFLPLAMEHKELILGLTPTTAIHFVDQKPDLFGAGAIWEGSEILIPLPSSLKDKEKTRLLKEQEKLEKMVEGAKSKLDNSEFRERAPKQVVEKLESSLKDAQKQLDEISQSLKNLS